MCKASFTPAGSNEFDDEESAWEFTEGLKESSVYVHYRPDKPRTSVISDQEINRLVAIKPPIVPEAATAHGLAPVFSPYLRPLLVPFLVLAAVGLIVSLWVHTSALLGRLVLPERYFVVLHLGIFVVWLPTVLVSNKLTKEYKTKDVWKAGFRGSPRWMERMVYGFGVYAMLNFVIFMFNSPKDPGLGASDPREWRGFSGHWMFFYSVAFATLYSAFHAREQGWRCIKGHAASPSAKYCEQCGQPVRRFS